MILEEILKNEKQNKDCICLYQEKDGWYAYEHSAFYCYSLLGIVDIGWLLTSPEDNGEMIIRVRISDITNLLNAPLLRLLEEREGKYIILCRNSCGGFHYWREEQERKCFFIQQRRNESLIKEAEEAWQGILYNQNSRTKEMSVSQQKHIPVIEGVYDPLSQRRDGTVTPCAPILIFGHNLLCWPKEQVEFCLCPVEEPERMMAAIEVHKHTEQQLLVTLPDIEKGEYQPVLRLIDDEGEEQVHYFPVTWQVKSMSLMEIYGDRRKVHPLRT